MVKEYGREKRIGIGDERLKRGGVDKAPRFVSGGLRRKRQDVVSPFDGWRKKYDTEPWPFPLFSANKPLIQHLFLIRVIDHEFLTYAVGRVRVHRRGAVVDLERQVKRPATSYEPEETIGLHLCVPNSKRQFILADETLDSHMPDMTGPDHFDDRFGQPERVCK